MLDVRYSDESPVDPEHFHPCAFAGGVEVADTYRIVVSRQGYESQELRKPLQTVNVMSIRGPLRSSSSLWLGAALFTFPIACSGKTEQDHPQGDFVGSKFSCTSFCSQVSAACLEACVGDCNTWPANACPIVHEFRKCTSSQLRQDDCALNGTASSVTECQSEFDEMNKCRATHPPEDAGVPCHPGTIFGCICPNEPTRTGTRECVSGFMGPCSGCTS
jgi:hypothetical protein